MREILVSNYDEINEIMEPTIETTEETMLRQCDEADKGGGIPACHTDVRIFYSLYCIPYGIRHETLVIY